MAKKGLAYTLNLSRKLSTDPVFYVGMLNQYRDPSHVNVEALAPWKAAVSQAATSGSRHPIAPSFKDSAVPAPADASAPLPGHSEFEITSYSDCSFREPNQREVLPIHRPPLALLDEHDNLQFHVGETSLEALSPGTKPVLGNVAWASKVVELMGV